MSAWAELGRFARSNLSSIAATGLDWTIVALAIAVGLPYLPVRVVAALAGATVDFGLKRHWAFARDVRGHVTVEAARYLAISATSLVLNVAASYALVEVAGMAPLAGVVTASLVVGVGWNYPLHRWFVFAVSADG